MHAIVAVLACLTPAMPRVVRRQLTVIILAMLTMTGQITHEPMKIKCGAIRLPATAGNAARIDWKHPALSTIQGDMT